MSLKNKIAHYFVKGGSTKFWYQKVYLDKFWSPNNLSLNYYIDFSKKINWKFLDGNDIPILNYGGNIGWQYNPVAIAQYGLGAFTLFKKTNNLKFKNIGLKQTDWLVNNLKQINNIIWGWEYSYITPGYELLRKKWISALAQGQGISLITRAFLITNNEKYLETAEKAFQSFLYDVKDGGVKTIDRAGNIFFEEVPSTSPSYILDGFMFALLGIYDYYLLTHSPQAKILWDEGIKTLKSNLIKYDLGFWSRSDLYRKKPPAIASLFYHNLHIIQLAILYKITGEPIFIEYSKRWKKFQKNLFFKTLAIFSKLLFKIFFY